jgi:hypothetical protein
MRKALFTALLTHLLLFSLVSIESKGPGEETQLPTCYLDIETPNEPTSIALTPRHFKRRVITAQSLKPPLSPQYLGR